MVPTVILHEYLQIDQDAICFVYGGVPLLQMGNTSITYAYLPLEPSRRRLVCYVDYVVVLFHHSRVRERERERDGILWRCIRGKVSTFLADELNIKTTKTNESEQMP